MDIWGRVLRVSENNGHFLGGVPFTIRYMLFSSRYSFLPCSETTKSPREVFARVCTRRKRMRQSRRRTPSYQFVVDSQRFRVYWVAVQELNLGNYVGETTLFTMNTYGNLLSAP